MHNHLSSVNILMDWRRAVLPIEGRSRTINLLPRSPEQEWSKAIISNAKIFTFWTKQEFAWHTQIEEGVQQPPCQYSGYGKHNYSLFYSYSEETIKLQNAHKILLVQMNPFSPVSLTFVLLSCLISPELGTPSATKCTTPIKAFPSPSIHSHFGVLVSSLLVLKNIFLFYSDDFNTLTSEPMAR